MTEQKRVQWVENLVQEIYECHLAHEHGHVLVCPKRLGDALDRELRARSKEANENGNLRNAMMCITVALKDAFPELALSSTPNTVMNYVRMLVDMYKEEKSKRQSVEATVGFAKALEMLRKAKVTQ